MFLISCDDNGHDALATSAIAGNAEMIQLLLNNGASVHNTPEGHITPCRRLPQMVIPRLFKN